MRQAREAGELAVKQRSAPLSGLADVAILPRTPVRLDDVDRRLLTLLAQDARVSQRGLARELRMSRLMWRNFLRGRGQSLNGARFGLSYGSRATARSIRVEMLHAWRRRCAVGLIRAMAVPLGIAVVVAVAVAGVVPRDLLVAVPGPANPFAVPVPALVRIPPYVAGEAVLPIAAPPPGQGLAGGLAGPARWSAA